MNEPFASSSPVLNTHQQHRVLDIDIINLVLKWFLSSSHNPLQMWPCLQSSPHPGIQAAGQIQPSQLFTLQGSQQLQGPLLMPHSPRAPPPHPLPFPPCPAVTQVLEEEDYRAGATALSACWRPQVVHLKTITMPMGLGGPEQWRTSTLSTKWPSAVFSHVFSGLDEMQKVEDNMGQSVNDDGKSSNIVLFVCFFKAISGFLWFEKGGEIMLSSSVSKMTDPFVALWLHFKLSYQESQWTEKKKATDRNGAVEMELEMKPRCIKSKRISAIWVIWLWFMLSGHFLFILTHSSLGADPVSPPRWRVESLKWPHLRAPESTLLMFVKLFWVCPGYPHCPCRVSLQSPTLGLCSTITSVQLSWAYLC